MHRRRHAEPQRPALLRLLVAAAALAVVGQAFVVVPPPPSTSLRRSRAPRTAAAGVPAPAAERAAAAASASAGGGEVRTAEGPSSLRLGVFIEHTDRYGMMYHSNYLKFLNRAIHQAVGRHAVLRLDSFRFKASARLGHDVDVDIRPKAVPAGIEAANPQAADEALPPGVKHGALLHTFATSIKEAEAPSQTFITADATTLTLPADRSAWPSLFPANPIPEPMSEVVAAPDKVMETRVWSDELDVNGLLAPHAVLSMFERGRSDSLGGPDRLEELMSDGYMFVVGRIDGYRFDPSVPLEEGDELQVLGRFRQKLDAVVTCEQVVITKHAAHGRPARTIVAQAVVTLACIGAQDGKMMAVPDKALKSMSLPPKA